MRFGRGEGKAVAACVLLMICAYAVNYTATHLFTVSITRDLGLERAAFMLNISIRGVVTILTTFFFTYCIRRFSLKRLILAGCSLQVLSYLLFAASTELWMFYVGGILAGVGLTFASTTTISMVIHNWFGERKGLVIGIVYSSSGFPGILLNPLVGVLLDRLGWRVAYTCIAAIASAFILLVAMLLKTHADGVSPVREAYGRFSLRETGRDFVESLNQERITTLVAISMLTGLSVAPAYSNVASVMQDLGFPIVFVSGVMLAVISVANCGGKLLMGVIHNLGGVQMVNLLGYACGIIGSLILCLLRNRSVLPAMVAVVTIGVSISMVTVPFPIMVSGLYGDEAYSGAMALVSAAHMLGQTIGSPLSNLIFDRSGSYSFAYLCNAVFAMIGLGLSLYVMRSHREQRPPVRTVRETHKPL